MGETRSANSKLGADIRSQYQQLISAFSEDAASDVTNNRMAVRISVIVMFVGILLGFGLSIFLGIIIARSIAKPIDKVVLVTSMLADGDINIGAVLTPKDKLYNKRKDEIGALARSIDKLVAGTAEQAGAASRLADGDLTVDIKVRAENDILGKALSGLVLRLNQLVGL